MKLRFNLTFANLVAGMTLILSVATTSVYADNGRYFQPGYGYGPMPRPYGAPAYRTPQPYAAPSSSAQNYRGYRLPLHDSPQANLSLTALPLSKMTPDPIHMQQQQVSGRCLVFGASGYSGSHLVTRLLSGGIPVRASSRNR